MSAPLVVFAVGNPSRGDDALGPLLAERLGAWLATAGLSAEVEVIEDFQLQIEHALDLDGRALALFVDAGAATPAPYTFGRAAATGEPAPSTHALAPGALLAVYARTCGTPPPAWVLCVRGESFALGEPLSPAAQAHADAALALLQRLCRQPDPACWQKEESDAPVLA